MASGVAAEAERESFCWPDVCGCCSVAAPEALATDVTESCSGRSAGCCKPCCVTSLLLWRLGLLGLLADETGAVLDGCISALAVIAG